MISGNRNRRIRAPPIVVDEESPVKIDKREILSLDNQDEDGLAKDLWIYTMTNTKPKLPALNYSAKINKKQFQEKFRSKSTILAKVSKEKQK